MHGKGIDAGGRVTRTGLVEEMKKCERISNEEELMRSACNVHDHDACIKSPSDKFLGKGGANCRTYLQPFHGLYIAKRIRTSRVSNIVEKFNQ